MWPNYGYRVAVQGIVYIQKGSTSLVDRVKCTQEEKSFRLDGNTRGGVRPLSLISNSRRVMKFACLSTFVRVRAKRDTVLLQVITLVAGIHDSTIPRTFFFHTAHTLRGNLVTLHNNHPPPSVYTNPQVSTVST